MEKETGKELDKRDKRLDNLIPGANKNGRPKGKKNFKTLFYEAIKKLAESTGEKPDEIELKLIQKGIHAAVKGDFRFWKDLHDRVHGQPVKNVDHTSGGLPIIVSDIIANKNELKLENEADK